MLARVWVLNFELLLLPPFAMSPNLNYVSELSISFGRQGLRM